MPDTSLGTPPGFNELPKAEQVRYLQPLWDQISEHPDELPVPENHLQLVENRRGTTGIIHPRRDQHSR